ncbi:hypothetical protein [Desulfosediminicola flagellatus]|uniref:hypothetical protein n=1 Tax=Desulfosediminicola flagellatus TaxID=2569541 RepID=UPI0010AC4A59|nr:hypothetical protein [Desulfosediminicola flagellatus]
MKVKSISKYFQRNSDKFDKHVAIENLVLARNILNTLNVGHWLTDGTLLGYYRENDFLSHDIDIDLGCFINDYTDEIIHQFISSGWRIIHIFGRREIGFELSFCRKDIQLDIFFFYKDKDTFWHGAWKQTEKGSNLIKYVYDRFELREIEFKAEKFYIPNETEKYIETKYGPDWRKPVKKWDWAYGPSNAVPTDYYMERY